MLTEFILIFFGDLYVWEEVLDDCIEEREVVSKELWHIGVSHSSDQKNIFREMRI